MNKLSKYFAVCSCCLFLASPVSGQIIDKGRYFGIGSAFKTFTITTPGLPVNAGRGINGPVNTGRMVKTPFGREAEKVMRLHGEGQTFRAIIKAEVMLEAAAAQGVGNWGQRAACLDLLARLHFSGEDYGKAEEYFKRAMSSNEMAAGKNSIDLAESLEILGVFYCERAFDDTKNADELFTKAAPVLNRAVGIKEEKLGAEHLDVAQLQIFIGVIYQERDHRDDLAAPYYRRALSIRENKLDADDLNVAIAAGLLADVYSSTGKAEEAADLFKQVLKIREKKQGSEHPALGNALVGLTSLYLKEEKLAEAEPYAIRILAIKSKQLGDGHIGLAYHQFQLALIYQKQNQSGKAEVLYDRALAIREKEQGSMHADLAPLLHNLAILYQATGRRSQAVVLRRRSEAITAKMQ